MLGLICGIIFLISLFLQKALYNSSLSLLSFILSFFIATFGSGVFAYGRWSMAPQISQLQPEIIRILPDISANDERALDRPLSAPDRTLVENFRKIHGRSVNLNGAVLVSLLVLLALL